MSFTDVFGGSTIYPAQPSYAKYTSSSSLSLAWPLETAPSNNVVAAWNDISLTAGGLSVNLSSALDVSVGITAFYNNIGANQFTVLDNGGGTILTATTGAAWGAVLTSASTASGAWTVFQLGAGISSASAAALAGYGLVAITTTLNQQYQSRSFSTASTFFASDRASTAVWTGGGGTQGFDAAVTLTNGWFVNVSNQGTGALILDPNASELIDGSTTKTINPGQSCIVVDSGTAFYTIGFGQNSVFSFDYTSIDVSGSGNYTLSGTELNRIAYKFIGVLTGNRDIIVPSTVQQYWVDNSTTGSFTLGVRTVTQASPGVAVGNGSTRMILYSNGTNVVNGDTNGLSAPITITEGGTGATTASGARVNLDVPSNLDAFTYTQMFS